MRQISNVCIYINDILILRETEATHLQILDEVIGKLKEAGLRLKREKCTFMLNSVEYLKHNISADGLRPTEEKTSPSYAECGTTLLFLWACKLLW